MTKDDAERPGIDEPGGRTPGLRADDGHVAAARKASAAVAARSTASPHHMSEVSYCVHRLRPSPMAESRNSRYMPQTLCSSLAPPAGAFPERSLEENVGHGEREKTNVMRTQTVGRSHARSGRKRTARPEIQGQAAYPR